MRFHLGTNTALPTTALRPVTHDANGNRTSVTNALGKTAQFAYDALDRLVQTSDALGNSTKTTLDGAGRKTKATDANGNSTSFIYDGLGHLTKVTDANGGVVTYTYDSAGNRTSMTEPNGHATTYTYDDLNRLTKTQDPSGGVYQYSYDASGNRTSRKDANGNTTAYGYDSNNRLLTITYPGGGLVSFTYDANGNRNGMLDALGSSSTRYDPLNRISGTTDAFGQVVGYGYDPNGNRTSLAYPSGKTVAYTFDAVNRLTKVTDWLDNATTYRYDAAGQVVSTVNPNGTTVSYNYDDAGRLVGLTNAKRDSTVISSYSLKLDGVGNQTQATQSEPLSPTFSAQNLSFTYDADNRLIDSGAATYTYDADGNLIGKGSDTFNYDFENRLTLAIVNGASTQYQYDGISLRKAASDGRNARRFISDTGRSLSQVLAETDSSGSVTAYYVYGLGLISRIGNDGAARYYHFDVRGSTCALSDAGSNVLDKYGYDPFGKVANSEGVTANPFKYAGRFGVIDEGNGLNYARARYFSTEISRFLTKDLGDTENDTTQSPHRYVYASNNPVRFLDITGNNALDTVVANGVEGAYAIGKGLLIYTASAMREGAGFALKKGYRTPWEIGGSLEGAVKEKLGGLNILKSVGDSVVDFGIGKLFDAVEGPGTEVRGLSWAAAIPVVGKFAAPLSLLLRYHEVGGDLDFSDPKVVALLRKSGVNMDDPEVIAALKQAGANVPQIPEKAETQPSPAKATKK